MARLLIKAVDSVHADPLTDKQGCYKRGDVVSVQEDSHNWGGKEGLPTFLQLNIAGIPKASLDYLVSSDNETSVDLTTPALRRIKKLAAKVIKQAERKTKIRRRFQLDLSQYTFNNGVAEASALFTQTDKRGI
jgi:hypothetical protein